MATDPELVELRDMVTLLAESTRELNDATRAIAESAKNQTNSSTIHIDAGGISAGLALSGVGVCLVSFLLFAMWTMWLVTDAKAQQDAWIQVWQQRMNQPKEN